MELSEFVSKIVKQNSANASEAIRKVPATKEGVVFAYTNLTILALLPIFFGSIRSVKQHKKQQQLLEDSGEKPDTMTQKDAALFPLVASVALFVLYVVFELFSKEYINLLLSTYFFVLGVLSLSHLSNSFITSIIRYVVPTVPFGLKLTAGKGHDEKVIFNYIFSIYDITCYAFFTLIGVWYLVKKHWIINNIFGISFAINAVELLHLNKVITGCTLLCGLFVYDVFWVFGTNVMVRVAKSFEAPIKLVFPQDLFENGMTADNFAMLGLGDIVIPGTFIALLLRFDNSLKRNTKTYFYSTFTAYFVGLVTTIIFMHLFNHAQPALLYLVPACLGTPLLVALIKGDIGTMFQYEDHPSEEKTVEPESKKID